MADAGSIHLSPAALAGIDTLSLQAKAVGEPPIPTASMLTTAAFRVLLGSFPGDVAAELLVEMALSAVEGVSIAEKVRAEIVESRASGRRPN